MTLRRLLIANRGEIAIRIARTAAELGIETVAAYAKDDRNSAHVRKADAAVPLPGQGVGAYLDGAALVRIARETACDALHPGYGFLSENAAFARQCAAADVRFVGPRSEVLDLFGDKARARALAREAEVPVLEGADHATSLDEARTFLEALGPGGAMMLKAVAGGGGRGIRPVVRADDLPAAYERCRSEALQAFGNDMLYVERLVPRARHVEVQIAGDSDGTVVHLWERDCTLQRHRQKLVEVAPAPSLDPTLRAALLEAAVCMARLARVDNLATFEFLVDLDATAPSFVFIEANARLQVEHTVTEMVTGLDLVALQLKLAAGATLHELGISQDSIPAPRGIAVQVRVNAETPMADGTVKPAAGTVSAFDPPSGPGVRVDTCGFTGYAVSVRYDSLLAKLIVHTTADDWTACVAKARRALREFRVEGLATNREFLLNLLALPLVGHVGWHTGSVDEHIGALVGSSADTPLFAESVAAGAAPRAVPPTTMPEGCVGVVAPLSGTIVAIEAGVGDAVRKGQALIVVEAMKMEHVVVARAAGTVRSIGVGPGDTTAEADVLMILDPADDSESQAGPVDAIASNTPRADLEELARRRAMTLDDARPDAVAKRRKIGARTARENIEDLCDPGSFQEYGAFVIAAQRNRRSLDDLIARTPADGMVMGVGRINGHLFPDTEARAAILSYDYTVLAGTQGTKNHEKKDRLFELTAQWRLPIVMFAEGGGGRPGDIDTTMAGSLHIKGFTLLAQLSGLVPMVGIVSGRCFAGNAVVAGCCDVIIATENASLGMGGPAMIEGGGLGTFAPDEVGPTSVQRRNGVIDVVVPDEAAAVRVAKQYLSYFQGTVAHWACADQKALRDLIPENRLRAYDVRRIIETLADMDSVLELRRDFAGNMVTAFVRVEGRPLGLLANNAMVLGGAIDANAADKAARFLQLCDAHDIPVLSLCDTPGNMVGPEAERTALVRHCCRLYVTGANLSVPILSIVLRKAYGLGAQGMVGGSFHLPLFSVAWPTGEFGPMNLEGAVRLGYRKELEAIADPVEREAKFAEMVATSYERGKALSAAALFEIDDVIDPAETRSWIVSGLRSLPPRPVRQGKKRPFVDTW